MEELEEKVIELAERYISEGISRRDAADVLEMAADRLKPER